MKTNKRYIIFSTLLLCALCSGILYSCFRPPSNTPCMPINFPGGKKIQSESRQIYTFELRDTYDDVYKFYRTNLKINPRTSDDSWIGTWDEYLIRDVGVLFECVSYLNDYESELGCIFVNKTDTSTVIYTMWSYNEGPGYPCYHLPEIEPDDY